VNTVVAVVVVVVAADATHGCHRLRMRADGVEGQVVMTFVASRL